MKDRSIADIISTLEFQFPDMEVHRVDKAVSLPHTRPIRNGWNIILMYKEPQEGRDEDLISNMLETAALVGARCATGPLLESPLLDQEQKDLVRDVLNKTIDSLKETVEQIKQATKDDATRQ